MLIKNNKKPLFILLFISLFLFGKNLYADEFNIKAKEILVEKDKEILTAMGSVEATDTEGKIILADKIRNQLKELGIELIDKPNGVTEWENNSN